MELDNQTVKGGENMSDLSEVVSTENQEQIKEIVSSCMLLTAEELAIVLSNVNAFKARREVERARKNL